MEPLERPRVDRELLDVVVGEHDDGAGVALPGRRRPAEPTVLAGAFEADEPVGHYSTLTVPLSSPLFDPLIVTSTSPVKRAGK